MNFPFVELMYPLATLLILWKLSGTGPIAKYRKARAYTPLTARKPSSLGINFPDMLDGSIRCGRLKPTGDGRYFLDAAHEARLRKRWRAVQFIAPIVIAALALTWWWLGRLS